MINDKFSVGQVIFVLFQDKMKVAAVKIVEEINRKTIDGENTSYIVQNKPGDTDFFPLENVKGEVFDDLDHIQSRLVENATTHIDRMINAVRKKSLLFEVDLQPSSQESSPEEFSFVTLEDGTRARVRV
jgi:hypothetical protein